MSEKLPRVSVGLPVYNGEDYVAQAIESILKQTFTDFEFIISDNCSNDHTEKICLEYGLRDSRIQYYRQPKNLGATPNENFLVGKARGEYFIWINHDDVFGTALIEKAVKILDRRASVMVAYGKMVTIDRTGAMIKEVKIGAELLNAAPYRRFARCVILENCVHAALGLFRTAGLRRILPNQPYPGSDHPMMAEVALIGELFEIPENLFFRRIHPKSSLKANTDNRARKLWFDSSFSGGREHPFWLRYKQFIQAVLRHKEIGILEQILCLLIIQLWPIQQFRNVVGKMRRRIILKLWPNLAV